MFLDEYQDIPYKVGWNSTVGYISMQFISLLLSLHP
jgi:hypothetical protein